MEIDAREFFENLDFDNMDYFYHITAAGNGRRIIEDGLYMEDFKLSSTTNMLTKELIEEIDEFLEKKGEQVTRKSEEMVIIACEKGDSEYLVQKRSGLSGNEEYMILPENIIGYIDLLNPNYNIVLNPYVAEDFTFPSSSR